MTSEGDVSVWWKRLFIVSLVLWGMVVILGIPYIGHDPIFIIEFMWIMVLVFWFILSNHPNWHSLQKAIPITVVLLCIGSVGIIFVSYYPLEKESEEWKGTEGTEEWFWHKYNCTGCLEQNPPYYDCEITNYLEFNEYVVFSVECTFAMDYAVFCLPTGGGFKEVEIFEGETKEEVLKEVSDCFLGWNVSYTLTDKTINLTPSTISCSENPATVGCVCDEWDEVNKSRSGRSLVGECGWDCFLGDNDTHKRWNDFLWHQKNKAEKSFFAGCRWGYENCAERNPSCIKLCEDEFQECYDRRRRQWSSLLDDMEYLENWRKFFLDFNTLVYDDVLFNWTEKRCVHATAPTSTTTSIITHHLVAYNNLAYYTHCSWKYYIIDYVDELNTDRCYVIKVSKATSDVSHKVNESFNITSPVDYFTEMGRECGRIRILGHLWCLRNKTKCLKLEENDKICHIIELSGRYNTTPPVGGKYITYPYPENTRIEDEVRARNR